MRRAGDRVRIVAQLIDAATDRHLWAETYDRQLTDIFAIQTDVALQIAAALKAELSPDERTRIRREPTADVQAYQLYLQGRHCYTRYTEESIRKGIEYFQQAIAADPEYALAHVGLALWPTPSSRRGEGGGAVRPDEAYHLGHGGRHERHWRSTPSWARRTRCWRCSGWSTTSTGPAPRRSSSWRSS